MKNFIYLGLLIIVVLTRISFAKATDCEITNDVLDSMSKVTVVITREDGSSLTFVAKLADDGRERAAGFQNVCGETMEKTPILFTFEQEVVPSFHMNNVVAPIDIAFIKRSGLVDVIHNMKTYSVMSLKKPVYSSLTPIVAALEVHQGFFLRNNIDKSSEIHWNAINSEASNPPEK